MASKVFSQRKFFNLNSEKQTQQQIQRWHQRFRIALSQWLSFQLCGWRVTYALRHNPLENLPFWSSASALPSQPPSPPSPRQQKLSKGKQGKKCRDRVRKIRRRRQRFEPNANSIVSLKAYTCQLELMCGGKITEIFSHLIASIRSS